MTRSETRKSTKTVSCPASVASVSTSQRRRSRPTASRRKRTNASAVHPTGSRRTRRRNQLTSRAELAPTKRASFGVDNPTAKPAAATTKTARPISATVWSSASCSFWSVRSASAITGKPSSANWFQTPVTAAARPTGPAEKPEPRSIAKASATPTAAPPGAMYVDAVEACVSTNARRKPMCGRAAIHGGANVTRLTSVTSTSAPICVQESCRTTRQTSP